MTPKKHLSEHVAIVIPARMGSGRLPDKPLREVGGKPLIQWAWEAAESAERAAHKCIVTDSDEIHAWCSVRDIECYMTDGYCTGSDRIAGLVNSSFLPRDAKIIVNLQCDEPDITGEDLDRLIVDIQTRRRPVVTFAFQPLFSIDLTDPNIVKVIMDRNDNAIYFSRLPLPAAKVHVGVYAYTINELLSFSHTPRGKYEVAEELEQLRMIEAGVPIKILDLGRPVRSINTEADLEAFGK